MKLLLKIQKNIDFSVKNDLRQTAFCMTVKLKQVNMMKLLLKHVKISCKLYMLEITVKMLDREATADDYENHDMNFHVHISTCNIYLSNC